MAECGRKTDLTDELFREIKQAILDGKNLKDTAQYCFGTLEEFKNLSQEEKEKELANFTQKIYNWKSDNYLSLSDKIEGWRRDRKLKLASTVIDEMLEMPVITLEWEGRGEEAEQVVTTNPALVKVKQDTAKFVLETLDRDNYSKRSELTGKNGTALISREETEATLDKLKKESGLYEIKPNNNAGTDSTLASKEMAGNQNVV